MVPDVLIISSKVWEHLTEDEKKWLQQAADESVAEQRKLWAESVEESLQAVQEAGVTVIYPDKEPFAEKVRGIYDMYKDNAVLYDLITRIQAVE
jgi:TRAP-type C4-dicarboxylate transport system substrate-binding protein